ncbi:hypothetical protein NK212_06235 [Elizabethkingia sp. S0634]|uniref:hypothetical protein n=1 Tax=Elizabethkingia sp. S0634 TaxID=2957806 RepID=UPI00209CDBF8|nr:hypothetical protein [Elizabethkingia sp. S0634]MCP1251447.1 hypothetical protein [Elizabethkingia sp. S0634]
MHKIKFLILSFIFLCCINKIYSQENKSYFYNKIGNIEGIYFINGTIIGKKKYLQILNDFESKLKKYNNGYQDYYRIYFIHDSPRLFPKFDGKRLEVELYPKKYVSKENKEKRYYGSVPSNTTIYKITYYFESNDKNNMIITKTLNKEIVE